MDYEKAYKDALERAKKWYNEAKPDSYTCIVESIFPELQESEGEKIRKEIIDFLWKEKIFLQEVHSSVENSPKYRFVMDAIAWLEKQGEQKPLEWHREDEQNLNACLGYIPDEFLRGWLTDIIHVKYDKSVDKVEPKFKVGDKICRKTPSSFERDMQVARIDKDYYICNHIGKFSSEVVPFSEESYYELIEQKAVNEAEQKVFDELLDNGEQMWSEEDERLCQCLIRDQEKALDEVRNDKYGHSEIISDLKEMYRERIDWLESLKQRLNK